MVKFDHFTIIVTKAQSWAMRLPEIRGSPKYLTSNFPSLKCRVDIIWSLISSTKNVYNLQSGQTSDETLIMLLKLFLLDFKSVAVNIITSSAKFKWDSCNLSHFRGNLVFAQR